MDSEELVSGWLSTLDLGEMDQMGVVQGVASMESESVCTTKGDGDERPSTSKDQPIAPTTPTKIKTKASSGKLDDSSPTTTNFSSIFDSPGPRDASLSTKALSNTSSCTSVNGDSNDEHHTYPKDKLTIANLLTATNIHNDFAEDDPNDAESLTSYDPPSTTSSSSTATTLAHPYFSSQVYDPQPPAYTTSALAPFAPIAPITPGTPQRVFITSCYQCTLAGLHCSRTLPSCTRCKRSSTPHLCLSHRRKLPREEIDGDVFGNPTPVLLKVEGEDEGVWGEKVGLRDELQRGWKEREERKNWVLPDVCGERGGWRKNGRARGMGMGMGMGMGKRVHPGEGVGRVTLGLVKLGSVDDGGLGESY